VFAHCVGADRNPPKGDKTVRNAGNVDQACWFKEGHFDAEFWGNAWARANGSTGRGFVIFFVRGDVFPSNGDGEQAIPIDIGHGIDEFPLTFSEKKCTEQENQKIIYDFY